MNMTEAFPTKEERLDRELHYYQYVPFILGIQFLSFLIPKFLANLTNLDTGNV